MIGARSLRCLYAVSEVAGFAKTGGLADVAAALPRALAERGLDIAVIMPLYRSVRQSGHALEPTGLSLEIPIGPRIVQGTIFRTFLPGSTVPVFLIDQPGYFDRDDPAKGSGLYQRTLPDGKKADYSDNCERFVFFSRAILEAVRLLDYWPDVLHCNDWQTALVPVYLRSLYGQNSPLAVRPRYQAIRSVLTVHNLAYQGVFWHLDMPLTGLPWKLFNYEQLEFYGHINFLKGGIVFADVITTVSPMYAREIQTPYFGCGLQGVLAQRSRKLHGIVNGVDYSVWNPATDPHLPARYSAENVTAGKALCKQALQRRYGLLEKPRTPLLGMVSRLVDQKGLDLLLPAAKTLVSGEPKATDVQLVVLGEGEPTTHDKLLDLRGRYPDKIGVTIAQDEELAHQIEAGADIFLMPSRFEPCGLNQLYSLKYGTVPVVRATGGLADTVVDATPENLAAGKASGISFLAYTPEAFLEAIHRALDLYSNHPDRWLALQKTGMSQDWSWNHAAAEYESLYSAVVSEAATIA